jgi:hypothetical protein
MIWEYVISETSIAMVMIRPSIEICWKQRGSSDSRGGFGGRGQLLYGYDGQKCPRRVSCWELSWVVVSMLGLGYEVGR